MAAESINNINEKLEEIWSKKYQRAQCIKWITTNKYKNICLQFPDSLLAQSEPICTDLNNSLEPVDGNPVEAYIMADTTYGDCCVDEITANHVGADCIVHFGDACLSETTTLPVFYCFPRYSINIKQFQEQLLRVYDTEGSEILVYLDIGYHHLLTNQYLPAIESEITDIDESFIDCLTKLKALRLYFVFCGCNYYATLEKTSGIDQGKYFLKCYSTPVPLNNNTKDSDVDSFKRICIFVGSIKNNRRFFNLTLTTKASQQNWLIFDPFASEMLREPKSLIVFSRYIQRRSYYIEKCKDAQLLGILVATVTMPGYLDIVKRLQSMASANGIRTKIIYVGRINPTKLANFMEIDCYILIGCPFNSIFESKDYFKPIVSVFEAEMALNPAWHLRYPDVYVTDFRDLLPDGEHFNDYQEHLYNKENNDYGLRNMSLIDGTIRHQMSVSGNDSSDKGMDLSLKRKGELSTTALDNQQAIVISLNKGLTLSERSWRGLEQSLGLTEPSKLKNGLSGIPTSYTHKNE